jgi:hypothetical protein
MPTRKQPEPKAKTVLTKSKEKFKGLISEQVTIGEELYGRSVNTIEELSALEDAMYDWDEFNKEILKQSFNESYNEYYNKYSRINSMMGLYDYTAGIDTSDPQYKLESAKKKIKNCIVELNQLISKSKLMEESESIVSSKFSEVRYVNELKNFYNTGFLVHGHNDALKLEVARFIEKELKLDIIILHEQPSKGRTIIEKFEQNSKVDFAVALWTADDCGKSNKENELKHRARQNVVFETGFFIGKLERSNVIVLYESGVEIPSDYHGVIFLPFNDNWKEQLRKEIQAIYNS